MLCYFSRNCDNHAKEDSVQPVLPPIDNFHDYHLCNDVIPLKEKLRKAEEHISKLEATISHLETYKFGTSSLKSSPNEIKFYSGFENYDMLKGTFEALQPTAEKMVFWSQYQRNKGCVKKCKDTSFKSKIPLFEQFFLFTCFLKGGLMATDISFRAKISASTTSRMLITWANYLYFVLGSLPIWPAREAVDKHMPDSFKHCFSRCRVIIDCTEIKCQTPTANVLNSMFYSQYKSHTTMKGLIGIAPFGAVTFVSELYTGLISDKEITKRSGILSLLEETDSVMMDKGFVIADLLKPLKVSYDLPPFLTSNRSQFEEAEVQETQNIARARIHVERAIRRIKENHIFDRIIPLNMAGTVNQLWTVSCLLSNFKGPLF